MGLLRLILALAVIASHCGPFFGKTYLVGGSLAVQCFFIISGFYMSLILNEKYTGENYSYRLFISNRFLRIYPLYWFVLLLSIVAGLLFYYQFNSPVFSVIENYVQQPLSAFSLAILILIQLFIFGQDALLFMKTDATGSLSFTTTPESFSPTTSSYLFVSPAWTLALELMFYVVAPFIVKREWKFVAAIMIISLALRMYLYNAVDLSFSPWSYRFFPTELLLFLLGYFSYKIYVNIKTRHLRATNIYMLLAALMMFIALYFYLPDYKFSFSPFSVKETILFISVIGSIPFLFAFFKNNKIDYAIGELSYPVYLIHWLTFVVLSYIAEKNAALSFFKNPLAVALVAILMALFINRYITYPINAYRQKRLKNPPGL